MVGYRKDLVWGNPHDHQFGRGRGVRAGSGGGPVRWLTLILRRRFSMSGGLLSWLVWHRPLSPSHSSPLTIHSSIFPQLRLGFGSLSQPANVIPIRCIAPALQDARTSLFIAPNGAALFYPNGVSLGNTHHGCDSQLRTGRQNPSCWASSAPSGLEDGKG